MKIRFAITPGGRAVRLQHLAGVRRVDPSGPRRNAPVRSRSHRFFVAASNVPHDRRGGQARAGLWSSVTMAATSSGPLRVLVAGGGVAGLETLLALRHLAGERIERTLLPPEKEFVYRPMAVAEPFSRGHAQRHRLDTIAEDLG